jgi:hypothetical protein
MKNYRPARKARHPRVPAFVPVPGRSRRDGWTAERQARFLAELALTRSVSAAARKVGMARETAYRLRGKRGGESFAAAWDRVLGREVGKRKVSLQERHRRAIEGLLRPRIYRGKCTAIEKKADNSALLSYLAQLDRARHEDGEPPRRSQSFAHAPAVREAPLPRRTAGPISAPRRTSSAPGRRGPR